MIASRSSLARFGSRERSDIECHPAGAPAQLPRENLELIGIEGAIGCVPRRTTIRALRRLRRLGASWPYRGTQEDAQNETSEGRKKRPCFRERHHGLPGHYFGSVQDIVSTLM